MCFSYFESAAAHLLKADSQIFFVRGVSRKIHPFSQVGETSAEFMFLVVKHLRHRPTGPPDWSLHRLDVSQRWVFGDVC